VRNWDRECEENSLFFSCDRVSNVENRSPMLARPKESSFVKVRERLVSKKPLPASETDASNIEKCLRTSIEERGAFLPSLFLPRLIGSRFDHTTYRSTQICAAFRNPLSFVLAYKYYKAVIVLSSGVATIDVVRPLVRPLSLARMHSFSPFFPAWQLVYCRIVSLVLSNIKWRPSTPRLDSLNGAQKGERRLCS